MGSTMCIRCHAQSWTTDKNLLFDGIGGPLGEGYYCPECGLVWFESKHVWKPRREEVEKK
jgi:hypothetical protein